MDRLDTPEWKAAREFVLRRDLWRCRVCGQRDKLDVHHIVKYKFFQNNDSLHLITLCGSCHKSEENKSIRLGYLSSFHRAWIRENMKLEGIM